MNQFPGIGESTLNLALSGPDIGRFRRIFNLPGSATGPFELDARLQVSATGTELLNVKARTDMADTTVSGSLTEPPDFVGSVPASRMDELDRALGIALGLA